MCRTPARHSSIAAAQDGSAGKNEFSLLATPAAHACTVHAQRGDKYASLVFVGTSMIMIHWTSEFDKVTVVLPRCCCLWARSAGHRQKACISTRGDTSALCVVVSTSMIMLRWTSEFDQVTVLWLRLCYLWAPSAIKRQKACRATLPSKRHTPQPRRCSSAAGPVLQALLPDEVPVNGCVTDVPHLPFPYHDDDAVHLSRHFSTISSLWWCSDTCSWRVTISSSSTL